MPQLFASPRPERPQKVLGALVAGIGRIKQLLPVIGDLCGLLERPFLWLVVRRHRRIPLSESQGTGLAIARLQPMTSIEWNRQHPIGTKVVLTLANGKRHVTRTASQAETWGARHHVRVEAIGSGYVLLEWVRAFHVAGVGLGESPTPRVEKLR